MYVAVVCMQQFVAMFVGGGVGGRNQGACTACLTRSTRGVRQVLLEHVRLHGSVYHVHQVNYTSVRIVKVEINLRYLSSLTSMPSSIDLVSKVTFNMDRHVYL